MLDQADLHWWHVAHLRIFQPVTDSILGGPLPEGILRGLLERGLRDHSPHAAPAVTMVPLQAAEPDVVFAVQFTVHDPLKLDTQKWVRTLHS